MTLDKLAAAFGDEHVEVIEGTLLVGTGDRLDPKMTQALAVGDSATAPAGMNHFSVAKGRTVVSVTFMGPYTITYVRAEDRSAATELSVRLLRGQVPRARQRQ